MTGPWTLPVLSRVGRRSRNDEAAQRHLGKIRIQGSGSRWTTVLYRSSSCDELYDDDQVGLR
ncbi:hypothetical protein ASPFODRAFT_54655 [Aspergillus luchuensis CBS 106.47]|uniref:Uncharacterized protein n=1 Tax=Aspergillus luchuensis (strain CBS 106.47) TaxID=1137211 RepID=A0A1M3SZ87_ASPLC|nr:hypothetical protein ASPFODRAFT_54655 [Aspergillus luchuensis CBS 106.47]